MLLIRSYKLLASGNDAFVGRNPLLGNILIIDLNFQPSVEVRKTLICVLHLLAEPFYIVVKFSHFTNMDRFASGCQG